ncbi:unnamed protein product [Onchocerca ochengi]|uniref:tRNA-synt_1c domain-containing protein n=1 Tax=Onchocerca ochengi TaxID=42157 RepID=A0A182EDI5_ONCOC|nr:unnamed protein product [Onchocerca ochengi]
MCRLSCASGIAKEIRLVVRISSDHLSLEGLRRALYNFLFARANNGKFILQLGLNKHGKQPRSKKIETLLDRFGLERDEGPGTGGPFAPYSVAKRLKTYADVVERLIDTGLAYRCFCCGDTWKEMDPMKKEPTKLFFCSRECFTKTRSESRNMALDGLPHVVRLRIPSRAYLYRDVVHGELSKHLSATDQLLLRPDFMPTTFFADTVDNHTLCASHHVASSSRDFLQLAICDALQWYLPTFINIGSLRLRSGSRLLTHNNARSYVRTYSSVQELSILNFLLADRGLRKTSDRNGRLYNLDEMIAQFDISTITSKALLINTYKLMKPERQETLLEQQLELDEEMRLFDILREFLKKVRSSCVDYDDYWIEKLVKVLPKDNETNDALIESLKFGTDKLSNQNNFYFIHLSLIKEIISNGDKNLWNCDFIKNFVRQFLNNTTFDGSAVVMNTLFMLYRELEEKNFSYEDEEVVQKALQLLNDSVDSVLKVTICSYLDKIFGRKYNTCWASSIIELLKTSNSGSPHKRTGSSAWRERLSQLLLYDSSLISIEQSREIFALAKNLEKRIEHIDVSGCEIMSMNFHFCKLLAELVQKKKMDEKIFFDDDWCSIHIRNEVLLQLIAMGHEELIKVVWDTPNLRLLDLVKLGYHSDKDYLNRGLSILCKERDILSASKFIASLENPSIAVLDSLYNVLELHNMINAMILNALLQKSKEWNKKIIPVLASKAAEQLNLPRWECRDNALSQLTVLVKFGYSRSDLIQCITNMAKNDEEPYVRVEALVFLNQIGNPVDVKNLAGYVLLSDSDSAPRIEAVQILHNNLPQTEELCLDLIPKILYDEDIALHRMVIDLCADLIINGRNQELRNLLVEFLEQDEVDCYEQLNEILYGKNKGLSLQRKDNSDLEYIFKVLAKQDEEDFDKDCYDL